jgi:hypothetical protein
VVLLAWVLETFSFKLEKEGYLEERLDDKGSPLG